MALPPTTANWHWKNKNITRWGTEWFERELTTLSVTGDNEGQVASISAVTEVDGDIELGQRKSKLITIFDCKLAMKWQGTTSDGTEVQGNLTIPEVSHEIVCDGLSDFVYQWSLTTAASPEVNAVFELARKRLPAAIETKLATFPSAIIDTHGKDLTVSADLSRTGTPTPAASTTSSSGSKNAQTSTPAAATAKPAAPKGLNVTTISVEAEFRASADDLFGLLTDEKRIPAWTRAPAKSIPTAGFEYSLFGGGVRGKYISLKPGKEITQTWALQNPTWPSGHEATLTTTLDQSTESTTVKFSLAGVPLGMEEELKKNIEGYYVHGFKSIGYVCLIPTTPVYSSSYLEQKAARIKQKREISSSSSLGSYLPAIGIATLVLVAAFAVPYFSAPPSSFSASSST